jgi:hypothetical protein
VLWLSGKGPIDSGKRDVLFFQFFFWALPWAWKLSAVAHSTSPPKIRFRGEGSMHMCIYKHVHTHTLCTNTCIHKHVHTQNTLPHIYTDISSRADN